MDFNKFLILFIISLIIVMVHGSSSRPNLEDPNSSRSSRLLYSPRSPTSRLHNIVEIHTVLRRLRENQLASERKQNLISDQTMIDNQNRSGNHFSLSEDGRELSKDERSLKAEICHSKSLRKCGTAVIEGFQTPNLSLEQKCRIRENFLHCMIKMKHRPCRIQNRSELTEEVMRPLRQKILQLLWSARACVLGMDLP